MVSADEHSSATRILPEDELKRISRQVKELVPKHPPDQDDRINLNDINNCLFVTAQSPSLSATHRVAAWNTLCAFIDELARADRSDCSDLLWANGLWRKAFGLYVTHGQYARPKSAKQLLVTLGSALRKCHGVFKDVVDDFIVAQATEYLLNDDTPRQTKAFLQLLTQLLSKDLIPAELIDVALSSDENKLDVKKPNSSIGSFLTYLFRWASHEDFGSVAGRCLSVILDQHHRSSHGQATSEDAQLETRDQPVWASALDTCLQDQSADIEQMRIHIFPVLFGRSLSQYAAFVRAHGLDRLLEKPPQSDERRDSSIREDDRLLYAALLSGKELGLIQDVHGREIIEDATELRIPVRMYAPLLSNPHRDTRITGFSLLTASRSATRPFLTEALKLLKATLPVFFADNDANFRSEVFSLIQRLMDRLRSITAVLARTIEGASRKSMSDDSAAETLQQHRVFLDWLLRCLTWELRPTASYQRHISGLKSLSIVARSGIDTGVPSSCWTKSAMTETKWPFGISILHPGLQRMLLDLLMDPFDDVRQTASSILSMYAGSSSQVSHAELSRSLEQGEKVMLATGRADQADGVAHMYSLLARTSSESYEADYNALPSSYSVTHQLLADLDRMLENARASLATAAKRYPMHGLLTSIRFILSQQSSQLTVETLNQLIKSLHRVWETVKPVLCNDAPEGFEVEETDESAKSQGSTQDVLSYCWRALKESSLLLGTLVTDKRVDTDHALGLGDLCFSQLAELRHRGAFSTVAQTWVLCSNRAAGISSSSLDKWLEQTFDILKNRTTINTRRSAGIPSLLCGLLIADKSGVLLSRAFQDLSSIAKERVNSALANESSLPQVHALNCIKDLLKNTRLGEQSERYVPSALRLAADSLQSEAWAIRNCGLMLFRGVIDRLLGTSDAYLEDDTIVQKRILGQAHPGLLDTVLQLLTLPEPSDQGVTPRFEGVFPALQMLQRTALPQDQLARAQDAALDLTCSPSWHVRDKAARTYAALAADVGSARTLAGLLESRVADHNGLHGALLCIRYVVKNMTAAISRSSRSPLSHLSADEGTLGMVMDNVESARRFQESYAHPVTRATFADIFVEYLHLRHCFVRDNSIAMAGKGDALRSPIPDFLDRLRNASKAAACAIERASLARAFAYQLMLDHAGYADRHDLTERATYTIVQLGHDNVDACAEFWRALHIGSEGTANMQLRTIMIPAAAQLLSGETPVRVKREVQSFLLYLTDTGDFSGELVQACAVASSPLAEDSNQAYADQWLQLHALVLDNHIAKNTLDTEDLIDFITSCKAAADDLGFYSREAAALALSRMQHIWPFIIQYKSSFACDIYLTTYDLLNDDDEDLRLLAAATVLRILRYSEPTAKTTHFEPITAGQRLLGHMVEHLQHDRVFASESFSRAFNTEQTVVDLLDQYSRQDTALFAQEKQNLYIDDAREAKIWAQVLLHLPLRTIPKRRVRDLASWVDEGLDTLISYLTGKSSTSESGTLDGTSKPETFVLGLQVIYGVEFLLAYLGKGGRLPIEGSRLLGRTAELREALGREGKEGPVLWLWECERVLDRAVQRRVGLAKALMGQVSRHLLGGKRGEQDGSDGW